MFRVILLAATLLVAGSYADNFGTGANEFSIDFVEIGYAGNTADTSGYGAVDYNYRIGMTEVTIDQFAKARAADSRIGDGNEAYWNDGTRTVGVNGPASQTSWHEAAKFANWLTTGDAHNGVYQFDGSGTLTGVNRSFRNGNDMAYVLPSEDEWYKAAYYKPINDGSYSLYANGSDNLADLTHGTANGWNYNNGSYVIGDPNYTWETGFGADEQNGTFDMMGNVREWNENLVLRGGSSGSIELYLRSSTRDIPTSDYYGGVGFRVAAIPEPSSAILIAVISGFGVFIRRRFPCV